MSVKAYLQSLEKEHRTGIAQEHAYRPALKDLVEASLANVTAVNDPEKIECGAPDFILREEQAKVDLGYIEAKDLQIALDKAEQTDQMERYRAALDNLILTNYLEFRFYRLGEAIETVAIARLEKDQIVPEPENFSQLEALLLEFGTYQAQPIRSAEKLAELMAHKASWMRNAFLKVLQRKESSFLKKQHEAFKKVLLHDMEKEQFADVYAQTVAYGLFIARLHEKTPENFSRFESFSRIPKSNPFLQHLLNHVSGPNLEEELVWVVEALCAVFRAADFSTILKNFRKRGGSQDLMLHFYETFLAAYDPTLKKDRGVWYTPDAVVNFIIRALDDLLKTRFDLKNGLADTRQTKLTINKEEITLHKVQMLDMATGTGTFLASAIEHIHRSLKNQSGIWSSYVETHLLPRLHGFELLMAPYAMCHLKIDMLLKETGYDLQNATSNQRVGVYLTNALEEDNEQIDMPFTQWLAEEVNAASRIKRDLPLMVIFGNPPYNKESVNRNDHIDLLMKDYKKEPQEKEFYEKNIKIERQTLQEKNSKPLSDDYVKFMRMAENFIEKNGEGLLGFITNHSYLDNPTFRGMRWQLLETFDEIYVLDLHGNSRKKEVTPQGNKDENVFNIQQGVAIFIGVKIKSASQTKTLAKVYHADAWGLRQEKYDFLEKHSLASVDWQVLPHQAPHYFFIPKNYDLLAEYEKGFALQDLFPVNSVGITTARDSLSIHFTQKTLLPTLESFASLEVETARRKYNLREDTRDWKVKLAQEDLKSHQPYEHFVQKISYRPFDTRWTYYTGKTKGFHSMPRRNVMSHMLEEENLALNVSRQQKSSNFRHIFCHRQLSESALVSNRTSEGSYTMPLYLYEKTGREPNLEPKLFHQLKEKIPQLTPEDLFDYIYAVLHSRPYRQRYQGFLKSDFPRIPFPEAGALFESLVEKGRVLRELHLLEGTHFEELPTTYPVGGSQRVEKVVFKKETPAASHGKVFINASQYFGNVPEVAWEFYIGGYQPAQKWLKDRKDQTLNYEQIEHYQRLVLALQRTEEVMQAIEVLALLPQ